MNSWPITCVLLALLAASNSPRAAMADVAGDSAAKSESASVDITIEQAKEMILDFISKEEAKEKKAGAKTPFFITASRPILEKREMVRWDRNLVRPEQWHMIHDEDIGTLIWGPWCVRPGEGSVSLQTDPKDGGRLIWRLEARIAQVDGKYRLTDPKLITMRGPFKIGQSKRNPSSK